MKILAEDLARVLYNSIQWSAKDSSLGGVVYFASQWIVWFEPDGTERSSHSIEVYASDDYVAMKDSAPLLDESEGERFHLGLKEVKELEKAIRDQDGELELAIVGDELHVDPLVWSGKLISGPPDFSQVVEVVHSEPNPFTGEWSPSAEPFAIRAERFTKFRLLRTPESPSCKDGYPVDFLWDGHLIRWKCGPFLRGVVGPLARHSFTSAEGDEVTGLKDLYATEPEVMW